MGAISPPVMAPIPPPPPPPPPLKPQKHTDAVTTALNSSAYLQLHPARPPLHPPAFLRTPFRHPSAPRVHPRLPALHHDAHTNASGAHTLQPHAHVVCHPPQHVFNVTHHAQRRVTPRCTGAHDRCTGAHTIHTACSSTCTHDVHAMFMYTIQRPSGSAHRSRTR